jgi:hypothetical protein
MKLNGSDEGARCDTRFAVVLSAHQPSPCRPDLNCKRLAGISSGEPFFVGR